MTVLQPGNKEKPRGAAKKLLQSDVSRSGSALVSINEVNLRRAQL